MLITTKLGNLAQLDAGARKIDRLPLEWYEAGKRMQRKRTTGGDEMILKFLDTAPEFTEGDILLIDTERIVVVEIIPCDCLTILADSMYEMASLAYEIGNKHLPVFFENNTLLVPMDAPLFRLLTAQGYQVQEGKRKLLHPLKTTVSPHGNSSNGTSLFSKIMQLTNTEK